MGLGIATPASLTPPLEGGGREGVTFATQNHLYLRPSAPQGLTFPPILTMFIAIHRLNSASPMQDDDIANIMRALGHPVRLSILRFLASQQQRECCCGDVTESLPLAQSTVSQHIKVLLDAGLIERKPTGTRNRYMIRQDRLAELGTAFGGLIDGLNLRARLQQVS